MRFSAVVFDMDGLMFDTERLNMAGWLHSARAAGWPITEAHIRGTIGFNAERTHNYYAELFGSDFDCRSMIDTTRHYVHSIVETEGLPKKPGLIELLDFLKAGGYAIGLATSSDRADALYNLEHTGLLPYFNAMVCGDMVAHGKPAPDIYLEACARLGANPHAALAIEDSPTGIRAATSAGMRAIMVPDLIQPDAATQALVWHCCDTLHDNIGLLRA